MSDLKDIPLPPLGDGVTEATFVEWLAKPGIAFKAGDIIAEIMTDKVAMEVEAEEDGMLVEMLIGPDDEVPAGAILGRYKSGG